MAKTLLSDALTVTGSFCRKGSVLLGEDGTIERVIYEGEAALEHDGQVIDLGGKVLMAGGIDAHVHFREPGLTQKADMESESRAAVLGGVTSFMDMPNTSPATTSLEALQGKIDLASGRCWADFGFHLGATNSNLESIERLLDTDARHMVAGIKVFMGSSTGNMLVDREETLRSIFRLKGKPVLVHSEDEGIIRANLEAAKAEYGEEIPFTMHSRIRRRQACVKSTVKALEMAIEYGTALHVLHVTTMEEAEMIRAAKLHNPHITAETSANYLTFCEDDLLSLGGKLKCNPAIKGKADREFLLKALAQGNIDTLGSDHAPHLLSEKERPYLSCPSGIPSIQYALAAVIAAADRYNKARNDDDPELTLCAIAKAWSERPAEILGLHDRGFIRAGQKADLIALDPNRPFAQECVSKCGWSPYSMNVVTDVWLAGERIVAGGKITASKPSGKTIWFD